MSRASFVLMHGATLYLFAFLFNDPLALGWPTVDNVGAAAATGAGGGGGVNATALCVDAAVFLLWAAQHSGMARPRFKEMLWGPAWKDHPLERPLYALVSVGLLVAMCELWAPPFPHETLALADVAPWRWAIAVPLMLAAACTILGFFWTLPDHIFGTSRFKKSRPPPQVLFTWPYSMVRHPANASVLWLLGGVALLGSSNHAAYASLWAAYVVAGTALEERGCAEEFGPPYQEYRREVGGFVPKAGWFRRAIQGRP